MERTEPTLIPEWLKNSTSSTGFTSPSHADNLSAPSVSNSKSSLSSNGHNILWPSGLERTSRPFTHWSSSGSNSGKFRSYSSTGRNQRDKRWEKGTNGYHDQSKSFLEDRWHREVSEPEGNTTFGRLPRDALRRSQSMIPVKCADSWTRKGVTDLASAGGNISDGELPKITLPSGRNKTVFERNFPSLKADERAVVPDVGRVRSPGLAPAIESLPISPSASLGEKWTSALAEVPLLTGSNGSTLSSGSKVSSSSSASVGMSVTTVLNMAEAVSHGPLRTAAAPQLSIEAQRREELAIKQSRQLIPVTPSIPKALALNSSDKQRIKLGQTQPPLSAPFNQPPRGLLGKGDSSKPANPVKFHILKSDKEKNGVTSGMKETCSTTNGNKMVGSGAAPSSHVSCSNGINQAVHEKRPTSQAQSRNEFFKLVRKKCVESTSAADSDPLSSSSAPENNDNSTSPSETIAPSPTSNASTAETCHSNASAAQNLVANGDTHHPCSDQIILDEEEEAFLRSLGWEENDEEEEDGLTEEEISAFRMNLSKYMESNPSPRILQGTELRSMLPLDKGDHISADSKLEC